MISEIHDGSTRELLLRAGLASGHRYVEFGCGLGYVTRWAGSLGAHATGIDLSEDQIAAATELVEDNRTAFRTGSIYEPGLDPESIDIAYCRWLLVHLERPVSALSAVWAALKPGGAMVMEEADVSAVYAEPHCQFYADMRDVALAAGQQRGVDYTGGRRAHLWARDAGFTVEHVNAYHPHYLEGPHKGFWNWTFQAAGATLVKAGHLPAEKMDALVAGMSATDAHPHSVVAHCRMHQVIARKPLS